MTIQPIVGMDFGLWDLAVTSDGHRYHGMSYGSPDFEKDKKLRRSILNGQRRLQRKEHGSKKERNLLIKIEEINLYREKWLRLWMQEIARNVSNGRTTVFIEDMTTQEMIDSFGKKANGKKDKKQRIAYLRAGPDILFSELEKHVKVIRIEKYFPSTKKCNYCQIIDGVDYRCGSIPTKIRSYRCLKCNRLIDRDINAARNILWKGCQETGQDFSIGFSMGPASWERDLKRIADDIENQHNRFTSS